MKPLLQGSYLVYFGGYLVARFSLLYKYNLFLTSLLFLAFLVFNSDYSFSSLLLAILGALSSAAVLYIILYLILFLFSFTGRFGLYLTALCFLFVNISLIVDFFIYRLYNFHINAMVLNILTSPKALDSIQPGFLSIAGVGAFIVALLLLELFWVRSLLNRDVDTLKIKNRKWNKAIILPLFLVIITEKVSYGFASLFFKTDILNTFRVIPLYQPLTFNRFASKYFNIKIQKQAENFIPSSSLLDYPKKPLVSKKALNKVNIFIIVSDSVNDAILNNMSTPNIAKFKQDSLVFENHYSGGNSTRFGIFSFFYGLNSTYWFPFFSSQKGPVLFDYLKNHGYEINIISSTNTAWPEFNKTAYVNISDKVFDQFKGSPWEKDKQSSRKALDIISKMDTNKPQFTFLFMDAPHGYSFPETHHQYKVKNTDINYLTLTKDSPELKDIINSYKNALAYNDMLFGKIITKLKEKGLYDNSIILYTSDHGHELFEYGSFGHNSSFSKAQTKVPFLMKIPEMPPKAINKMTSHLDFVPTILSYIGVQNKPDDYSNGYNLLDKHFKRDSVFIANWNNNAIKTDEYTYVFSNLPNKMFNNEIRKNSDYSRAGNKHKIDSTLIMSTMKENSHFYQ